MRTPYGVSHLFIEENRKARQILFGCGAQFEFMNAYECMGSVNAASHIDSSILTDQVKWKLMRCFQLLYFHLFKTGEYFVAFTHTISFCLIVATFQSSAPAGIRILEHILFCRIYTSFQLNVRFDKRVFVEAKG